MVLSNQLSLGTILPIFHDLICWRIWIGAGPSCRPSYYMTTQKLYQNICNASCVVLFVAGECTSAQPQTRDQESSNRVRSTLYSIRKAFNSCTVRYWRTICSELSVSTVFMTDWFILKPSFQLFFLSLYLKKKTIIRK